MNTDVAGTGIPLWLVILVVVVALLVGASMISVVLGKYAFNQWFHPLGGPMLSFLGVILIGLSVFGNVRLKVGEFEGEITQLRAEVEFLENSLEEKTTHLAQIERKIENIAPATGSIEPSNLVSMYLKMEPNRRAATEAFILLTKSCIKLEEESRRELCLQDAISRYLPAIPKFAPDREAEIPSFVPGPRMRDGSSG